MLLVTLDEDTELNTFKESMSAGGPRSWFAICRDCDEGSGCRYGLPVMYGEASAGADLMARLRLRQCLCLS